MLPSNKKSTNLVIGPWRFADVWWCFANFGRKRNDCDTNVFHRIIYICVRWGFPRIKVISTRHIWERTSRHARKLNYCLMLDYTHVLELNKTSASKMLMRHLNLPLPMDTNSSDERNFLSGAAKMPVPYHLDESDSDSIVSRNFHLTFIFSVCVFTKASACIDRVFALILERRLKLYIIHLHWHAQGSLGNSHVRYIRNVGLVLFIS